VERKWRKAALAVAAVLVIVIAAAVVWKILFRPAPRLKEVASVERMAFALPDKPSIAVLPFVNISGDPEQDYISDGITEQIITALSSVPTLFVIARNSVFTYKGKPVKIQQVAEELGVRYVLEGSFQRSEDRVRISAQLIDAITGHHMWAKHYDRDMKDLFALQDEIALNILKALEVELKAGLQAFRGATDNLEAYLKVFKGLHHIYRWTKDDMALARNLFEEAIALDPNYADAYHLLGWAHYHDNTMGWSESPAKSFEKAEELARKAIALDDSLANAHALLGFLYQLKGQHEKAIAEGERAVELSPNSSVDIVLFANILMHASRPEEGVVLMERAIRLDPTPPNFYLSSLGMGYSMTGRHEEAIEALNKALLLNPNHLWTHIVLAITYISLGREEEARAEVAEILRISPKFSLEHAAKGAMVVFKNPAVAERIIGALRKAGLK
jgi:adenylate cyclase